MRCGLSGLLGALSMLTGCFCDQDEGGCDEYGLVLEIARAEPGNYEIEVAPDDGLVRFNCVLPLEEPFVDEPCEVTIIEDYDVILEGTNTSTFRIRLTKDEGKGGDRRLVGPTDTALRIWREQDLVLDESIDGLEYEEVQGLGGDSRTCGWCGSFHERRFELE